ncbi:unnamed protein product [Toxocara canis]|uniref:Reverse transcriptase n=1 Tax=Toxocara canis TaxID=6265 RepID=A0A183VBF0_TOXCA|nr:unnamed protein product [Toxocara canis]
MGNGHNRVASLGISSHSGSAILEHCHIGNVSCCIVAILETCDIVKWPYSERLIGTSSIVREYYVECCRIANMPHWNVVLSEECHIGVLPSEYVILERSHIGEMGKKKPVLPIGN